MAPQRATGMLVDPRAEWTRIEHESDDPAFVLSRYVALLALVPAVSSFVGASLIGVAEPGGGIVRTPIVAGLFGAIFGYVMSCATVLLLGLVIDLVAPLFGGRRDFDRAFRLAAYSFTPVWLAGIFLVLPGLRFLTLTGAYGAYILWLGLPALFKLSPRHAPTFTVSIVLIAGALLFVTATAQRLLFGTPGL